MIQKASEYNIESDKSKAHHRILSSFKRKIEYICQPNYNKMHFILTIHCTFQIEL